MTDIVSSLIDAAPAVISINNYHKVLPIDDQRLLRGAFSKPENSERRKAVDFAIRIVRKNNPEMFKEE